MNTAITALNTTAKSAQTANKASNAESANTDGASFGTMLNQSVAAQSKDAEKTAAASAKTDDDTKSQNKDDASTDTETAAQDASAALLQALAALGLAPATTAAASTRTARAATTDTQATSDDGATGATDGVARAADTSGTDGTIELGTNLKNTLKNNSPAALARTTADTTDAANTDAAKADVAARSDAGKDALTARLTEALRSAAEGERKSASSADTNTTPRFSEVLGGLSAAGAATSTASTASTNATTQQTIHSQFGSASWANEVTEQVRSFTLQKIEVAELKLNPQDLGPIRVEIALDQGNAAIHFSAARDDVRDALAQNIDNLRDSLANAGVSLQNASTGNFGDGQAFSYMQRQAASGGNRSSARGDADAANDTTAVAATTTSTIRRASADGVDLFA